MFKWIFPLFLFFTQVAVYYSVIFVPRFATEDMMKQYGVLLMCFEDNGEVVNNCIFTMMHHVAGDLENVSVLFQPTILSSFTRILETEFQLCDVSCNVLYKNLSNFSPGFDTDQRNEHVFVTRTFLKHSSFFLYHCHISWTPGIERAVPLRVNHFLNFLKTFLEHTFFGFPLQIVHYSKYNIFFP